MRNYIKTRALTWTAYVNPPSDFYIELYSIQNTDEQIASDVQAQNEIIINNFAPTNVDFTYPLETMNAYWLLDKANVMKLLQKDLSSLLFANSIGSFPFGDPNQPFTTIAPGDQMLGCLINPDVSPRYTGWKDNSGVTRAPTPSDKGAKTPKGLKLQQVAPITILSEIYAVLVAQPNPSRELKAILADILANIRRLAAGTETQAQLDAIFAELQSLAI